ncbi:hypothetical protein [Agrobacterium vitis]|nr:hypothetical protein [Agrobacterium vitis]KAA3516097.1 hypothetical protein DXM22_11640 [Agrobacterium vitis]
MLREAIGPKSVERFSDKPMLREAIGPKSVERFSDEPMLGKSYRPEKCGAVFGAPSFKKIIQAKTNCSFSANLIRRGLAASKTYIKWLPGIKLGHFGASRI